MTRRRLVLAVCAGIGASLAWSLADHATLDLGAALALSLTAALVLIGA